MANVGCYGWYIGARGTMSSLDSDHLSLNMRIRRKIWWLYHKHYIYDWLELKGRMKLRFYQSFYPNFHMGNNAKIWGNFYVTMYEPFRSRISVGHNVHMVSDQRRSGITLFSPCKFTTIDTGEIVIGENVQINGGTVTSRKYVEIGDGSLIAPNCIIVDSDFHAPWPPDNRGRSVSADLDKEIVIGKNVWLGLNVVVLKGVEIGDNSIIGAGSVVVQDIPQNVMAAGAPAKEIKSLGP